MEGDINQADSYANLAIKSDRYSARALVNKGNCLLVKGELERSKEMYLEAIGVEADCVEAIYNLGLVNKRMGILTEVSRESLCYEVSIIYYIFPTVSSGF